MSRTKRINVFEDPEYYEPLHKCLREDDINGVYDAYYRMIEVCPDDFKKSIISPPEVKEQSLTEMIKNFSDRELYERCGVVKRLQDDFIASEYYRVDPVLIEESYNQWVYVYKNKYLPDYAKRKRIPLEDTSYKSWL